MNQVIKAGLLASSSIESESLSAISEEEKGESNQTPPEFEDGEKRTSVYNNTRKSILKSAYLTNKRQSHFHKNKLSFMQPSEEGSLRKSKTEVEGRLPIRRPSQVDPSVMQKDRRATENNLSIFSKIKSKNHTEDEKGELEYINNHEDSDIEDLNSFLSKSLLTNKFQIIWAVVLFLTHTYNMLSFWYYAGIIGYPKGELLALQLFFEFIMIIDFIFRLSVKCWSNNIWGSIWLLHDYYSFSTRTGIILNGIASIPIMFLVS